MIILPSVIFKGIDGIKSEIQISIARGIPSFQIVGMVDKTINESKERIRSALNSINITLPPGRITVNIFPGDIHKEGTLYDLPIAIGILLCMNHIKDKKYISFLLNTLIVGELSLDGRIMGIKHGLLCGIFANKNNNNLLIAHKNHKEAILGFNNKNYNLYTVNTIEELINQKIIKINDESNNIEINNPKNIFQNVYGNLIEKRACAIALTGKHNILLIGPPGSGKSLLAKNMENLFLMDSKKSLETSAIYSIANLLENNYLIKYEPFRQPHHSLSKVAMVGGGSKVTPGEISLSHNGILYLDEIGEFAPSTLDTLRQPLEEKKILISRSNYNITLPANIHLVCTMNPCKCGYYGLSNNKCICSVDSVIKYQKRISGPLLDRITIKIFVTSQGMDNKNCDINYMNKIIAGRKKQLARYENVENIFFNRDVTYEYLKLLNFGEGVQEYMEHISKTKGFSNRKIIGLYGLSRTIADYDGEDILNKNHINEALLYHHIDSILLG